MSTQSPTNELRVLLQSRGFAVTHSGGLEAFRAKCGLLGRITQEADVCIKPEGARYPDRPDAVPFHTDNATVPYIGWHCLAQDDAAGELMLLDIRPIIAGLPTRARELLGTCMLQVYHQEQPQPVLVENPFHFYWVPRFVTSARPRMDEATRHVINALQEVIESHWSECRSEFIRLAAGEEVFVDNRFILHGRREISPSSKRHLVRAFMKP